MFIIEFREITWGCIGFSVILKYQHSIAAFKLERYLCQFSGDVVHRGQETHRLSTVSTQNVNAMMVPVTAE